MAVVRLQNEFEVVQLLDEQHNAILHTFHVDHYVYGVWYIPLSAGFFAHQNMVEMELGRGLPEGCYEIKFALRRDFDDGAPDYTLPKSWPDLGTLSFKQAMGVGEGLLQSQWLLRRTRDVRGFVAVALEDRPKLGPYYGRMLRKYQPQLGYNVHPVLEGSGYAIF
ncbi:hypothetical protein LOY46_03585 [Pseudomonas sichuanensis]|uniref:hypothetical protein n=1 Tax=Pseudomonas sichuanensis TaxID=2213015 RepID=UPI00215E2DCF|nr:hypothetical protein [Pseudomonas sichuanensis]UVK83805.1 hypothetical protein LOY46_03585 [Pseudomonas sichuanensis]